MAIALQVIIYNETRKLLFGNGKITGEKRPVWKFVSVSGAVLLS